MAACFDPAVAVRWSVGALLLAALVALGRAGVPVLWGRRALVVWVLVALLHVTAAPATDLGGITRTAAQTTQVLVDLPSGAAAALLFAVSLVVLLLLRARVAAHGAGSMRVRPSAAAGAHPPILSLHLASRAPPIGIRLIARGSPLRGRPTPAPLPAACSRGTRMRDARGAVREPRQPVSPARRDPHEAKRPASWDARRGSA